MPQLNVRPEVEATIIRKCWDDEQYRARFVANPTETFKQEMALIDQKAAWPAGCEVRALVENDSKFYLVVPEVQTPVKHELVALTDHSTRMDFEAHLIRKAVSDPAFRQSLLGNPKAAYDLQLGSIKKGAALPLGVAVQAFEETSRLLYVRIPQRPAALAGTELSDAELQQVAGGVGAVGVAIASYVVVGAVLGAVVAVAEEQA